ncbi:M17 family metallopeptidase [Inmirania thermothiophila]|uniref:Leucyl aminopeptidase n=1 Tax=Inmirania thermothiophila TaxID=1750597 RepID=A0A3N1Y8D4_9GAMM|nr:M17 family metallopeptidase [Inmirania thermothiophila]ROR35035.1 leucyl aminopeptidase [Inmirania thermothiophila]
MSTVALRRGRGAPDPRAIARAGAVLLALPREGAAEALAALPHGEVLAQRLAAWPDWPREPLVTTLPDARGTPVALAAPPDGGAWSVHAWARRAVATLTPRRPGALLVWVAPGRGLPPTTATALARAALATAPLPAQRREPPRPPLTRVEIHGEAPGLDPARLAAEAEGTDLARALTARPANALTAADLVREARALARRHGWRARLLTRTALQRRGAGAFCAVTRLDPEAGILHLHHRGAGAVQGRVALVGKGICFDTGGVNLKPARAMQHMHEDMAGAAVALGTLLALTRLGAPLAVDCWLALGRNEIGPGAYRPGEVVRALDGTTIEVVHSDAEGRMVLADTLVLAGRARPQLILDFATLTGACIHALGTRYNGVFSNRPQAYPALVEAGEAAADRVWPFPMSEDYDEALESEVADVRQCTLEGEADHILGARFLARFVPRDIPWVHVDLAAARSRGGLGPVPTEVTGAGVRFALELLLGPARGRLAAAP